jgi:alkyl hydroperoxide reductase subunit AhpC
MLRWMQLGANNKVTTPVNWKNGEDVIVAVASATSTASSISLGP